MKCFYLNKLIMKKKWILVFLCLLLVCSAVYAAEEGQSKQLEERIVKLEKHLDINGNTEKLPKDLWKDIVEKGFETIEKKYENAIVKLQNEQDAFKNDLKSERLLFYLVIAFLAIVGGWNIFWSIPKKIENRIDQKVDTFFEKKIRFIKELTEKQKVENRIKDTNHILILGNSDNELLKMREHFHLLKFKNLHSKLFQEVIDLNNRMMKRDFNENEFDLIVFNQLDSDKINMYMQASSKEMFIGYTLSQLQVNHREKISFANSPFTLYARTLEVLKFQYDMDQRL